MCMRVGALPAYMSIHHICSILEDKKKVLDLLELGLQMVVSYHVGAGNRT